MAKIGDLSVTSSGQVVGRLLFRFPSFCRIDYRRQFLFKIRPKFNKNFTWSYPEERNDCCLFLGLADIGRTVEVNT